jgi:hypothetical protein
MVLSAVDLESLSRQILTLLCANRSKRRAELSLHYNLKSSEPQAKKYLTEDEPFTPERM